MVFFQSGDGTGRTVQRSFVVYARSRQRLSNVYSLLRGLDIMCHGMPFHSHELRATR